MNLEKRWLNISEAAQFIGMSVGFMRKATRNRLVPHTRVGSKSLRYDREALDVWLASNSMPLHSKKAADWQSAAEREVRLEHATLRT